MRHANPIGVILHRPDMMRPRAIPSSSPVRVKPRAKAADFVRDYEEAANRVKAGLALAGRGAFRARMEKCTTCRMFAMENETLRCNHVERACSVLEPWKADEVCKAGYWQELQQ